MIKKLVKDIKEVCAKANDEADTSATASYASVDVKSMKVKDKNFARVLRPLPRKKRQAKPINLRGGRDLLDDLMSVKLPVQISSLKFERPKWCESLELSSFLLSLLFVLSVDFIMAVDDAVKFDAGPSSDLNLSFGDPLYLHPHDTSGSPIVTINSDLFAGAIYAKTASEMWDDLKETYDKVDGSAVLPPCNCDAAKHFDQHNQLVRLMQFLMGFNESYLAIRSNLLTREPLPSVKTAFSVISGEESHRNISSIGTTKPAATAFLTKTVENNKKSNNATTSNCHVSLSSEQLARLMNLLNENVASTANANMAGANQHMTMSAKFLSNVVDVSNLGLTVGHHNGTQALITKIRDLKINNKVTLYDVLVDLKANKTVKIGKQHNGLYLFDTFKIGNDDSEATLMDEINNTHPEGTVSDETNFINEFYENLKFNTETEELPVNTLRRSSRQTKLPSSLNDFVVEGKVKYGVEKVVNYAYLNLDNYCFISALNKSIEPNCYEEAILDSIDFDETFSPVVKMSIVRCVIASSVTNCWPLFQLDFNNAFLYGDLDEDIYMTIPKGFASKDNKNKYKIKDLGHLKYFLGIEVIKSDKDLCMSQRKYYLELLKEYGLLGCKPVSTPMEPNSVLPYVPTKDDPLLDNITAYQKLLRKLIYLSHTRPDIAYSVHCLAQYMHSPLKSHLNNALNVLRYLKGAPGKGIRYIHTDCKNNLNGYSDADWEKCLKTRKSVTRYCVFFNNCLIS
ncbi:ribonuclease H-like domain-containing protein [Tanacetum coccineum]